MVMRKSRKCKIIARLFPDSKSWDNTLKSRKTPGEFFK